jgi:hypothetical protein
MNRILFLLMFFSAHTNAFIDLPVFAANPVPENTEIKFSVRRGVCDGFIVLGQAITTVVDIQNNIVTYTVPGIRLRDIALCNVTIGAPEFIVPPQPPGNYILQFRVRDVQRPDEVYTVNPVAFSVTAGTAIAAQAVPGLNSAGMALLVLGLCGFAAVGWRKVS